MQEGVKVITRLVQKIRKVASHATQGFKDRTSKIKEKFLSISKVLRRRTRESWEEVNEITQEVIEVTESRSQQSEICGREDAGQRQASCKSKETKVNYAIELTGKLLNQAKQVV